MSERRLKCEFSNPFPLYDQKRCLYLKLHKLDANFDHDFNDLEQLMSILLVTKSLQKFIIETVKTVVLNCFFLRTSSNTYRKSVYL